MAQHWDGKSWSIVPTPNPTLIQSLYGVAESASNDVWAVGAQMNSSDPIAPLNTLTMHWDGKSWNIVTSPNLSTDGNILQGVTHASGSEQVWTAGDTYIGFEELDSLIMHTCP
ncbi:hypothetical protein KSC_017530 [Ktedonobacter sp. SOSP1-52]|uniref:hypothetical protein n=1 Tax=Ktedonobacter sp. SOSP1-52 TaxID=2778366 RepID=UPI001915F31C|nr:hypothetical protein [Ktedonobacter sp. SOSP1-52]GHO62861.1 hypothetical protein KSC_017530 [Ktedonobacter sp. SOSP1-52]